MENSFGEYRYKQKLKPSKFDWKFVSYEIIMAFGDVAVLNVIFGGDFLQFLKTLSSSRRAICVLTPSHLVRNPLINLLVPDFF
jgi:hypothetical protein